MKLSFRNKAAFGVGALGKDIVYMFISSYLLYYYNAVLGMSSAFIGAVLMIARVFDAINDPFMGIVVAKTKTKWGRYRPWIFSGTVLNAVTIYALFATPKMGDGSMRIWLTVFYLLWGITYTLMDIPFWSMIPAVTSPGHEREQLSSLARSCAGIGSAIPTVLTMVIVPILSGSSVIAHYRIGFKWWALIIAIFFVISETICVLNVPEKKIEDVSTSGIREMFQSLFANDQAMTVVFTVIFVYTALNIVGNLALYFFTFDVGNEGAYSVFVAVCFAAQVLAMSLIPVIRSKLDKLQLFNYAILVQIIGFVLLLLLSMTHLYKTTSWFVLCVPGVLVYAGFGILNVLLTVFLSDSVDYGEAKNGKREESVIFSMQTFTVKLGAGLAVLIAGVAIDMIGLNAKAALQSAATLTGLRGVMTVPSVILLILALVFFKKNYSLTDEKMAEIQNQLNDKESL